MENKASIILKHKQITLFQQLMHQLVLSQAKAVKMEEL